MIKKEYLQPGIEVVNIEHALMICISGVKATGLDEEGSLDYGDDETKSSSIWDKAW